MTSPGSRDYWLERAIRTLKQLADHNYTNMCLIQKAPFRCLYPGGAGVAYTFWKAACCLDEPRWLQHARNWIDHVIASNEDDEYVRADDTSEAISERMHIKDSYMIGNRGVHFAKALVSYAEDNNGLLRMAIDDYTAPETERMEVQELIEGIAGRLTGAAIILRETGNGSIREHGNSLSRDLLETSGYPDADTLWHNNKYYGMAHGRAGNYYAALRWAKESGCQLPGWFHDELIKSTRTAVAQKDGLNWPRDTENAELFINSWCHGAPGHVLLWCLAYEIYADRFFLDTARALGKYIAGERQFTAGHICCGAAGAAYGMLALNRVDPDGPWWRQAQYYADLSMKTMTEPKFRLSLYRGISGQICLMLDMADPANAAFPGVE